MHHHHGDHDHHGHGHGQQGHDHHGHGPHVHVPFVSGDPRKALLAALVLNGGFFVVEAVAGWWTGSLALLSDAAHMASDVGALVLALGAAQLARRPSSTRMTFGLHRAEILGAFVNGLALLVAVGVIVWEAGHRLAVGGAPVEGLPVLGVGLVGLAINLGSAWALHRSAPDNLNVRGALVHMLADAAGSVGAVVAAGLLLAGVDAADAAMSLVIALLVLWGAYRVTADATRVLLQLPPPQLDVEHMLEVLVALEGVHDVHDVHVWTLDGHRPILTAHVVALAGVDPGTLTVRVVTALRERFAVEHVTIQVDTEADVPCAVVDCGVHAVAS